MKLLQDIVMLINDIEHFHTFLYELYCVVVPARQNTKGGKENTQLFTTLLLYTKKRKTNIKTNNN